MSNDQFEESRRVLASGGFISALTRVCSAASLSFEPPTPCARAVGISLSLVSEQTFSSKFSTAEDSKSDIYMCLCQREPERP